MIFLYCYQYYIFITDYSIIFIYEWFGVVKTNFYDLFLYIPYSWFISIATAIFYPTIFYRIIHIKIDNKYIFVIL